MNGVAYQRVRDVFHRVCEMPETTRAEVLREACGEDTALRSQVEALLAAQDRAGEFLEQPAPEAAAVEAAAAAVRAEVPIPVSIGRYRVVRLIAEGGMGSVLEATQESPSRTVAVKVIRPGMLSGRLLKRFEHEAQLLGRLQHPGIAQIHEAGVADISWPDGSASRQPFFAMEFVRGSVLTDAARGLGLRDRLALLARLCDGVHHGHQRGVIHRDLKPANILVPPGPDPQPKIIDFGVARRSDDGGLTRETAAGQILGTLAYMSPEQVFGDAAAVDTRTDVYSLGVIGYELLSGRLPHDLRDRSLPESVAIIRDREPPDLSTLDRSLRGDIRTIIAKAMEKDPARRYQSASDLGADLRRFLAFEPIAARPATTLYQLRRLARRHRGVAAGFSVAVLGLLVGAATATWQAVGATRQRDRAILAEGDARKAAARASEEARVADLTASCLESVFAAFEPSTQGGQPGPPTARAVLDRSAERVAQDLTDRPLEQAAVLRRIGRAYASMGLYDRAAAVLERALAIGERSAADPQEIAATLEQLAMMAYMRDDNAGAIRLQERALGVRRAAPGPDPQVASSAQQLGVMNLRAGNLDEAERRTGEALSIWQGRAEQGQGPASAYALLATIRLTRGDRDGAVQMRLAAVRSCGDAPETAAFASVNLFDLWRMARQDGDAPTAERMLAEAQRAWARVRSPLSLADASVAGGIGTVLTSQGRHDLAEPFLTQARQALRDLMGDEGVAAADATIRVGTSLHEQGRYAEAAAEYREALRVYKKLGGDEQPDVGTCLFRLAQAGAAAGDREGLASLAREAAGLRRIASALPANHPHRSGVDLLEGYIALALGDAAGAEPLLRECVSIREATLPPGHKLIAYARTVLGGCLVAEFKLDEAAALLPEAVARVESEYGRESFMAAEARGRLAALHAAAGR